MRSITHRLPAWIGAGTPAGDLASEAELLRQVPGLETFVAAVKVHVYVLGQDSDLLFRRFQGGAQQR